TSLTSNDNALDLFIKPGAAVGDKAVVTTGPPDPLLTIVNQVTTTAENVRRDISVYRDLGEHSITITGTIPLRDRGYSGGIGISHPAMLFVYLLRTALAQKGVTITGKSRTTGPSYSTPVTAMVPVVSSSNGSAPLPPGYQYQIATLQSPPFSLIAAQTLKPSQNLYTELILRTLGKVTPSPASGYQTSEDLGLETVKGFLKTAGIRPEELVLSDGSGLSRNDMVTAEASV